MPEAAPRPRPSDTFEGEDLGDEYMFFDKERDLVHVLNGAAREIFLLCDGKRSEEEIATEFADRFEVDGEVARRDARQTLEKLYELGLISPAAGSPA